MSKRHLNGGKICKHTTVTSAAEEVVKHLLSFSEVHKISLANISQAKGAFYIKLFEISGGWKLRIRGSRAIQEVMVYTEDKAATRRQLLGLYPKAIVDIII